MQPEKGGGREERRQEGGGGPGGHRDTHREHKVLPKCFNTGDTLRGRWMTGCAPGLVSADALRLPVHTEEIKGELGHGGFGSIYLAFDQRTNQDVAIKAAIRNREKDNARMYIEFRIIQRASELKLAHFVAFHGCGEEPLEDPRMNFIVMQLVSRNLTECRRKLPGACFSRPTALRTAFQAIEALRDMHNTLGYIHRDIKPSNMAFGAAEQYKRVMYLFDFGLARCWLDKTTREPLAQRPGHVGFRGTARYASIRCNQRMDQCRADDIVSVFFGTLELMNGQLPWRTLKDEDIGPHKVEHTSDEKKYIKMCGSKCPPLFRDVGKYLLGLTFDSEPNYQYVLDSIDKCLAEYGVSHNSPLDWEHDELKHSKTPPSQNNTAIPVKHTHSPTQQQQAAGSIKSQTMKTTKT